MIPPDDEAAGPPEDASPPEDLGAPPPEPVRARPALGPLLLLFAAGGWLVWAVLHFGVEPSPGPTLAVAQDEPPVPAIAPDAAAPPEPAVQEAPAEPDLSPHETPWVEPDWTKGVELPKVVTYTVRRGGRLQNVANLFKIYHHEILALNPGLRLEQDLAPGTKVVIYRARPGVKSESVGTPGDGSLEGAVPMLDGEGRSLKMVPWKSWGTAETVATLDRVLTQWRRRYPDAQPILVGNLSAPAGGKLEPHGSHQSGRDVDLSYPQVRKLGEELNWREMNASNLDCAMTWNLLELLVETGAVERIYIDSRLQKILHEWARRHESVPARELRRWLEYPRPPGSSGAIVEHVAGHVDHLHVRFACAEGHSRCRAR